MLPESSTSHDDPKIVGESSSEEVLSRLPLPAKNPQIDFLETAKKQQERKLQYREEKGGDASPWNILSSFLGSNDENESKDLNQLYRDELENGRVRPIEKDYNKSELENYMNKLSALSTDELEAFVDQNSADLKDLFDLFKVSKAKEGGDFGDAFDEDMSRSQMRNTVTEEGDRDGLDPHHHPPQQLQDESELHNSRKKQLQNENQCTNSLSAQKDPRDKAMSTSRRKNPSVRIQSKLLAKTVKKKQQEEHLSTFFASLFSDGASRNNQDLNDAYRNEMLRRKVRSSDPNLSLSIKAKDSNDFFLLQTVLDSTFGTEDPAPPPSDNIFAGVFFRPSYVGGHEDDAVEALNNRDMDESPDSEFILHLVS